MQIALPSVLYFYDRSETSLEGMRVKVQPSLSQELMLNEVTTWPTRGKAVWLSLPLTEMTADAVVVFWTPVHKSETTEATQKQISVMQTALEHHYMPNGCSKCFTQIAMEKNPHISNESYERYQGGFVTIFLTVVLGRGGFWHRVYVISKRPYFKTSRCFTV